MVIIAAFACMLIPAVTLHAGVSKLMMALVCALVPLAVTKQRRRLCIILFGFIVAILLVRIFVCGRGAEHLFDDWRVEYYAEAIRRTPWFGAYSGARTFKPFGGPWEDPVTHALLTLGRFVIPALIVALSLLTAASASIMFKKMDSARKIIVCGAALSFAIPLIGSVARLYFPLRIGRWSVPFLSPGGSSMVASFALLGLALTALDGEVRGLAKRTGILGRQIGRVVGVTLVGLTVVSVGVIVYQDYHSRLARIERAIPKTDGRFSYDIRGAVEMSDGTIWLPCREIKGNTFDFVSIHARALMMTGHCVYSVSRDAWTEDSSLGHSAFAADILCGKQVSTVTCHPDDPVRFSVFPEKLRCTVKEFADNGGHLIISGADIATDVWSCVYPVKTDSADNAAMQGFVSSVFGYKWFSGFGSKTGQLKRFRNRKWPTTGLPRESGFDRESGKDIYRVENPDALSAASPEAFPVMRYSDSNLNAGIYYKSGTHKAVSYGFPLETLGNREDLRLIFVDAIRFFDN